MRFPPINLWSIPKQWSDYVMNHVWDWGDDEKPVYIGLKMAEERMQAESKLCFGRYNTVPTKDCNICKLKEDCIIEEKLNYQKVIGLQQENLTTDRMQAMKEATPSAYNRQFGRYFKDVSNLKAIDVYKVLELFGVKSHALGHAVKKILVAGSRGSKDEAQDIKEAIAALERHLEMLGESNASN